MDSAAANQPSAPIAFALCQINAVVGDLAGNADMILDWQSRAQAAGATVAVFPELALSGYPPEDLVLRRDFLTAARRQLDRIAESTRGIVALVGFPEARNDGAANALAVLADGRVQGIYRKLLLPNYGVFDERRYFETGPHTALVELGSITAGLSICEDIWFDDPVFSGLAGAGAQIVLNASASPYHQEKDQQREAMVARRARRFGVPVVYCNLVGGQDELVFDGASFVIDAAGEVLARAPQFEEAMLLCEVPPCAGAHAPEPGDDDRLENPDDAAVPDVSGAARIAVPAETIARIALPDSATVLDAARVLPEPLGPEAEVWGALTLGIRDYVDKNGFPGVIVGVSGGIDSAVVLALAHDALGSDRVTGVVMPSPFSSDETQSDAREIVTRLGCNLHEFSIAPMMREFESALAPLFAGYERDETEENLQARIRGMLLMALSNKLGPIVLTTGNKSEMAVGYATLYGDMAGGFAALKDVPKSLVFRLARWRNEAAPQLGGPSEPIPWAIIERPPSAELRPDQRDEDSLGSYDVLDEIVHRYIELDEGLDELVAAGIDEQFARKVMAMIDRAEYKRRQAPPGVKITPRAFGRDRRMPITARRRY